MIRLLVIACTFALALTATRERAGAQGPARPNVTLSAAQEARADIRQTLGFVPAFLNGMPDAAIAGAWQEMKSLQLAPNTALPSKLKELIGLAVSAQVPCKYCTYAHTQFAKANGATGEEVSEAVVVASLTRHWSTVLNGLQTDLPKFKADLGKIIARLRTGAAGEAAQGAVPDAKTALAQIERAFGSVPEFLRRFPSEAVAGAWRELRDVQFSSATILKDKEKSLIGVAVASQIPCSYCLAADTEFAKLAGANQREIDEAIAMAALTRHWSTYLNGMQVDEAGFKRDIDRLLKSGKKELTRAETTP